MPIPSLPAWAQQHLQENLPAGSDVVNATAIGSRRVLANTRRGAVLVRKSFFGGVQHVLLEVPQARLHFPCSKCGTTVQVFGHPPQSMHCSGCNAGYVLAADGTLSDSMGVQVRTQRPAPAAARPSTTMGEPAPEAGETFTYNGYTLHVRHTASGAPQYFFAKSTPKSGEPSPMPDGYEVGSNSKTGLPFLRRSISGGNGNGTTRAKIPSKAAVGDEYHPQCVALTADGAQCRNSTRGASKYCSSHKGYQPPGARKVAVLLDTSPAHESSDDRLLAVRGRGTSIIPGEQCSAVTAAGAQCRNTARASSKYCPSHRSYQPPTARLVAARRDTLPKVKGALDTLPSVRRAPKKR